MIRMSQCVLHVEIIPGTLNREEALGHTRGISYVGLQDLSMVISPRRSWKTGRLGKRKPGLRCSVCSYHRMFLDTWNKIYGWMVILVPIHKILQGYNSENMTLEHETSGSTVFQPCLNGMMLF